MSKWRSRVAGWLRWLAAWIDVPTVPGAFDARVIALVREQEARWPDRDGEAKRHQVYARLIKDYPDQSRRTIARAIEQAVDTVMTP